MCRNEAIRTPDPYVPNVVRYQLRYIPIGFAETNLLQIFKIKKEMQRKFRNNLPIKKKCLPLQPQKRNNGAIAQLVEQRTENPCVPGSIPGGTTFKKISESFNFRRFSFYIIFHTTQLYKIFFIYYYEQ